MNKTRKAPPIIVALTFGGAARDTRARNGGQKYMNPTPCTAQNRNGHTHGTLPVPQARMAATRIRFAPPQMKAPAPIFLSSEGSLRVPRPCQRHKANSKGRVMILNNGSIDWNQGIGSWNPPALMSACWPSQT